MKITKYIIGLGIMAGTVISLPSCTDLSETVYDQVMSQNYYNTKQDVINAVFRPFEHIYESIVRRHEHEEDLFCCGYARYFWEAIKIRYPEYCFYKDWEDMYAEN